MSDDIKKLGLGLLKTPEGAAFARQVLKDGTRIESSERARLMEAMESSEAMDDPEIIDLYSSAFKESKLVFEWRNFSNHVPVGIEDYVKARMASQRIEKNGFSSVAYPAVEMMPEGRATFDASSYEFVANIKDFFDSRSDHSGVDSYFAYLDVDRNLMAVAPTRELAVKQMLELSEGVEGDTPPMFLPLVISYHSQGDMIAIHAHRSDGEGVALTEKGFGFAVKALQKVFEPYTAMTLEEIWNHSNPTLSPWLHPYGYDPFVYIQAENGDRADALDSMPYRVVRLDELYSPGKDGAVEERRFGGVATSRMPIQAKRAFAEDILPYASTPGEASAAGAGLNSSGIHSVIGYSVSGRIYLKAGK